MQKSNITVVRYIANRIANKGERAAAKKKEITTTKYIIKAALKHFHVSFVSGAVVCSGKKGHQIT